MERAELEDQVVRGVRSGDLSRGQARRILGFPTTYELDGFLKSKGVPVQESFEEVVRDGDVVLALAQGIR